MLARGFSVPVSISPVEGLCGRESSFLETHVKKDAISSGVS